MAENKNARGNKKGSNNKKNAMRKNSNATKSMEKLHKLSMELLNCKK